MYLKCSHFTPKTLLPSHSLNVVLYVRCKVNLIKLLSDISLTDVCTPTHIPVGFPDTLPRSWLPWPLPTWGVSSRGSWSHPSSPLTLTSLFTYCAPCYRFSRRFLTELLWGRLTFCSFSFRTTFIPFLEVPFVVHFKYYFRFTNDYYTDTLHDLTCLSVLPFLPPFVFLFLDVDFRVLKLN